MGYAFLADLVTGIHLGYVAFVVVGQLLIVLGLIFRWQWVRNLWFRCLHLLAIAIVAAETLIGMNCPLTDWEDELRALAHQPVEQASFIGRLMHDVFRVDLPYDHWALRFSYIGFAVLVLATFVLVPPRRKRTAGTPVDVAPAPEPAEAVAALP
jgi:hypothetical protein